MKRIVKPNSVREPDGRNPSNFMLILMIVGALVALVAGWRLFWFLTDDAFIAFRYISNSVAGYGYTWNLPPFRPVEGYTSFLWVVLLDVIWRLSGFSPPETANLISLIFAGGTLLLGIFMVWRLPLHEPLAGKRPWLLLFFLIGVLTNRTFLTWSSSGLETAMFNFFVIAWFCVSFYAANGSLTWMGGMVATAVLAALTRPDGLLLIAAALFLSGLTLLWQWRSGRFRWPNLVVWSPLLITAAHFLWRKSKYGEWLPNTFAAKYVAPWPESGWRYFVSFVLEYALWFWLLLAVVLIVFAGRQRLKQRSLRPSIWSEPVPSRQLIALVVLATLAAHALYYTFMIGGDYFEYRVYSHLIMPLFLGFIWLLDWFRLPFRVTAVAWGAYLVLSWLIPWTHWQAANALAGDPAAFTTQVPVAPQLPSFLRPYGQWFDDLQTWLIERQVAVRHHQHRAFLERQTHIYPSRAEGLLLEAAQYPVIVLEAVGLPGWTFPLINILDAHGLNDYVVARNPVTPDTERTMAHDRYLPVGYGECFRPNVRVVRPNRVLIVPRILTPAEIIACETAVWPDSQADEIAVSGLGVDYQQTPALDHYLWHSGPADMLFLSYVADEALRIELNRQLLEAFSAYQGLGCLIIPPETARQAQTDFLFAFFNTAEQPLEASWQTLFPWLAAAPAANALPHLGYTAVAGPEIEPQPRFRQNNHWANNITFLGFDLPQTVYQPGDQVNLTLYYQVNGPVDNSFSSFTHLLGTAFNPETQGPLWGQQDGNPCGEFYAMADWQPGSIIMSKGHIPLPAETPPGEYKLQTGFYHWVSGERVALHNENEDMVPLGTIQIEELE